MHPIRPALTWFGWFGHDFRQALRIVFLFRIPIPVSSLVGNLTVNPADPLPPEFVSRLSEDGEASLQWRVIAALQSQRAPPHGRRR